jgi:hypothetical protein
MRGSVRGGCPERDRGARSGLLTPTRTRTHEAVSGRFGQVRLPCQPRQPKPVEGGGGHAAYCGFGCTWWETMSQRPPLFS